MPDPIFSTPLPASLDPEPDPASEPSEPWIVTQLTKKGFPARQQTVIIDLINEHYVEK